MTPLKLLPSVRATSTQYSRVCPWIFDINKTGRTDRFYIEFHEQSIWHKYFSVRISTLNRQITDNQMKLQATTTHSASRSDSPSTGYHFQAIGRSASCECRTAGSFSSRPSCTLNALFGCSVTVHARIVSNEAARHNHLRGFLVHESWRTSSRRIRSSSSKLREDDL